MLNKLSNVAQDRWSRGMIPPWHGGDHEFESRRNHFLTIFKNLTIIKNTIKKIDDNFYIEFNSNLNATGKNPNTLFM